MSQPQPLDLAAELGKFQTSVNNEFDTNAKAMFSGLVVTYTNDLYVESRRRSFERLNDPHGVSSGNDVEAASARMDFRRYLRRQSGGIGWKLLGLALSIVTGIVSNWAFADFGKDTRSQFPWIVLVASVAATLLVFGVDLLKKMEP